MPKYSNFALIASFVGLWIDSFFSNQVQLVVGFVLIFTFGILHGANDLNLIENINSKKRSFSYFKFLYYYISMVLFVAILFYFLPALAMIIFLAISSYHFGEQQWQNIATNSSVIIRIIFQFCYGAFILLMLFVFHTLEVQKIVFEITSYSFDTNCIFKLLTFFGLLLAIFGTYFYVMSRKIRSQIIVELFYLLVFAIVFKTSSLIWGFALYFVLWHSIPSIIDQIKFIHGSFSVTNFTLYLKSGLLYWIISLIGIALLYLLFKGEKMFNVLFFSFLAAITFPHVFVIINMFHKKSNN